MTPGFEPDRPNAATPVEPKIPTQQTQSCNLILLKVDPKILPDASLRYLRRFLEKMKLDILFEKIGFPDPAQASGIY